MPYSARDRRQQHWQFAGFVLAGGVAAGANFLSRIVLSHWMPFGAAIVSAYVLGMGIAFVLNRLFVFRGAVNPLRGQAFWFTMINLLAVVQTLAVSLLLARVVFPYVGFHWHGESVAHAFGIAVPVVTSYVGHKRLSFRSE